MVASPVFLPLAVQNLENAISSIVLRSNNSSKIVCSYRFSLEFKFDFRLIGNFLKRIREF